MAEVTIKGVATAAQVNKLFADTLKLRSELTARIENLERNFERNSGAYKESESEQSSNIDLDPGKEAYYKARVKAQSSTIADLKKVVAERHKQIDEQRLQIDKLRAKLESEIKYSRTVANDTGQAWGDGYEAGYADAYSTNPEPTQNPYRAECG